jgi:hypothetical protein
MIENGGRNVEFILYLSLLMKVNFERSGESAVNIAVRQMTLFLAGEYDGTVRFCGSYNHLFVAYMLVMRTHAQRA